MTLESLARTIAKARHGTDAMWANYMGKAFALIFILSFCASLLCSMAIVHGLIIMR